jgi:hypothetical protein
MTSRLKTFSLLVAALAVVVVFSPVTRLGADTLPRCLSILPLCTEGCYVPTTHDLYLCLRDAKDAGQCQGCRDKSTGAAGYCLSVADGLHSSISGVLYLGPMDITPPPAGSPPGNASAGASCPVPCSGPIAYCKGYKYQLQETFWVDAPFIGITALIPGFVTLEPSGRLTIYAGYAWDGPSGPTIDTADFMRGSLAHDALYQLMREGLLNINHRDTADRFLVTLCREDGMSEARAAWVYYGVKEFAACAAERKDRRRFYAGRETVE